MYKLLAHECGIPYLRVVFALRLNKIDKNRLSGSFLAKISYDNDTHDQPAAASFCSNRAAG
ncbi:MAG: hypothetical protein AB7T15_04725, partial [Desulfuromonas sp.]